VKFPVSGCTTQRPHCRSRLSGSFSIQIHDQNSFWSFRATTLPVCGNIIVRAKVESRRKMWEQTQHIVTHRVTVSGNIRPVCHRPRFAQLVVEPALSTHEFAITGKMPVLLCPFGKLLRAHDERDARARRPRHNATQSVILRQNRSIWDPNETSLKFAAQILHSVQDDNSLRDLGCDEVSDFTG